MELENEMNEEGESQFDMTAALDEVAADLGLTGEPSGPEVEFDGDDDTYSDDDDAPNQEVEEEAKPAVEAKPAPKSWQKDRHESWAKIDSETQEYIELREKQMLDGIEQYKNDASFGRSMMAAVTPYKAMLAAQGLDETKAVQTLLNAHYRLTNGSSNDKANYFSQLAQHYGLDIGSMTSDQTNVDPTIKTMQDRLEQMSSVIEQGRLESKQATSVKITNLVNDFASDDKHPYFDEVADDIVAMIKAGETLESAYEKAVWANGVTRQKEISRIQAENEAAVRAKLKSEASTAKKATSTNINARDTKRSPTESAGTMQNLDGSLRETLRAIKSRSNSH